MTNLDQPFVSSAQDIMRRFSLSQSRRTLRSCHPKVVVRRFVGKDLIVVILANFSVMPKPVIELLDAESHAREEGLIVGMDVQNDAQTHVENATSASKMSAYHVVIGSPN